MAGVRRKPLQSGRYQGWYTDYMGKRIFFVGAHQRAETHRMAQRLEDDHLQIRLGYRPLPEAMDTRLHSSLRHVMDEYLAWGQAQGGRHGRPWGKTHLRNRTSQLDWWHAKLGDSLDAIRLRSVETLLRDLQKGRAPKTVANYAETIAAFSDWCVERGYLENDPLKDLHSLDTTPQTYRRSMTVEEITRLLEVCPSVRRLFLETAFLTGLRANELRNLTVEHLDVARGGLHLDAAWTKNRKPGFQPLPASLVARLVASAGAAKAMYENSYARGSSNLAMSAIPANPLLHVPSHTARSLDYDLKAAGIPKITPAGKLDFHAVRLAYINLVIEGGVSVKEAQALARHATPELTMNVYGRTRDERLWNAVEQVAQTVLPDAECAHSVHAQVDEERGNDCNGLKAGEIPAEEPFAGRGFDSRRFHFFEQAATPWIQEGLRPVRFPPQLCVAHITRLEIGRLAEQNAFFHWHLAFPDVFCVPSEDEEPENIQAGWSGGFDVVLGNPPWERTSFEDLQFFAIRAPEIMEAPTTARRKKLIDELSCTNPELYKEFVEVRHKVEAENLFYASSGRFPLGASGRTNTYALFTDMTLHLINSRGRSGTIVQTGIATDAPMEAFWKTLIDEGRIVSLYDFENRLGIFPEVHRSMKFCLLTLQGPNVISEQSIRCGFFLSRIEQTIDIASTYSLPSNILQVINPNTKQPPVCRSQKDLDMVVSVHKRYPILLRETDEKYRAKAWRALMSAGSSQHDRSLGELLTLNGQMSEDQTITITGSQFVPLIEAKQIHQFDPCFATYDSVSLADRQKGRPRPTAAGERFSITLPQPRFWAERSVVEEMFLAKSWEKDWSVGIRDVSRATDERTATSYRFRESRRMAARIETSFD
jgi:integrase